MSTTIEATIIARNGTFPDTVEFEFNHRTGRYEMVDSNDDDDSVCLGSEQYSHPKMPANAYIFYTLATRQSTVAANPNLSGKEIISMMAKGWKALSDAERAPYVAQAAADKARYKTEMATFNGVEGLATLSKLDKP